MKNTEITAIAHNPLYRVGNRQHLADLLQIDLPTLNELVQNIRRKHTTAYYSVRSKITGPKLRIVEQPLRLMRSLHDRLQRFLAQIEKPSYFFSGRKNISHLDVGKYHLGNTNFLTIDIRKFFPSTKREYVFRFFHYRLRNPAKLAGILADITCFNGHLPLGSPVSGELAFLAFQTLFDKIAQKATERGQRFSLYVDDMTFSAREKIPRGVMTEVNYFLRRVELSLDYRRTRFYKATEHKLITGMIITPTHKMKVPNKLRQKILDGVRILKRKKSIKQGTLKKLKGRIIAGQQIERNFFATTLKNLNDAEANLFASGLSSAGVAISCPKISGKTALPVKTPSPSKATTSQTP